MRPKTFPRRPFFVFEGDSVDDAECGSCFSGFCESGGNCTPCAPESIIEVATSTMVTDRNSPTSLGISQNEQCNVVCKIAVGGSVCLFILAGALILYFKKRKTTSVQKPIPAPNIYINKPHFGNFFPRLSFCCLSATGNPRLNRLSTESQPDGICNPTHLEGLVLGVLDWGPQFRKPVALIPRCFPGNPVSSLPESALLVDKAPAPSRSLQQGRHLYTVINAVPVRRWKEFVRGLGLRDGEIELVELEHSQFREQQYEMLKRWCQQRGASLKAILDTLEAMQLGGCAQELRENLQVEHLWCNP
ncbi:tumor necrosis factor receptor superfamily member 25 [Thamnophis elegans]|uniref:tumor necrosis factor receptor superfamily member 25 n=1 Tax=Thamnophis elegans TaxID=35005 RepID=UPI00137897DE|nr:tumor necrosis factor receptor superfamily member 25 [Thamnophis elegans]